MTTTTTTKEDSFLKVSLVNDLYSIVFFQEHITNEYLASTLELLDKQFDVQRIRFVECTFQDKEDGLMFVSFFCNKGKRRRAFYVANIITEFEGYGEEHLPVLPFRSIVKLITGQHTRIIRFKRTKLTERQVSILLTTIEKTCNYRDTRYSSPLLLSIESHNITFEALKRIYSLCTCALWDETLHSHNNSRHLQVTRTFYVKNRKDPSVETKIKLLDENADTEPVFFSFESPSVHEIKTVRAPLLDVSISNNDKVFFMTKSDVSFDAFNKRYRKVLFGDSEEYSPLFFVC